MSITARVALCTALALMLSAPLASAQDAGGGLDLKVPEPTYFPATTGDPPGTYYGDKTGKPQRPGLDAATVDGQGEDKARVSGAFTTGIGYSKGYGNSHFSAVDLNVEKPVGNTTFNLGLSVGQYDGPGYGGYGYGRGYGPGPRPWRADAFDAAEPRRVDGPGAP